MQQYRPPSLISVFTILVLAAMCSNGALITKKEFQDAVITNGFPAPTDVQYKNLITRAEPAGKITTKRELAMFLANVIQESDGLRAKEEYNPPPGHYDNHPDALPGRSYHGRGYLQLSWPYNYKAASLALYKDLRLLENPAQVAKNDTIAWDTAFWFWATNVHSQHGVSQGKFGVTVKAINGDLECTPGAMGIAQAKQRFAYYKKIFGVFKIQGRPIESGCYA